MEAERLNSDQVYQCWVAFGNHIGVDKLKKLYGGNWPRHPVEGESAFLFREDGEKIGWVSIRPDPVEPIAWLVMGIWPEFQKKNYAHEITRWAMKKVFSETTMDYILIAISRNNKEYFEKIKERVMGRNSKMKYAGYLDVPFPGYDYFAIERKRRIGPNN